MGRRGPKKTPAALKRERGTFRADRDGGPELPVVVPEPPEWLDAVGLEEWADIAPLLARFGLLAEADRLVLGLLCQTIADWRAAKEELSEQPLTWKSDKGYLGQNPLIAVVSKLRDAIVKLAREFGMTPSARAGLKPVAAKPADPMAQLMDGE